MSQTTATLLQIDLQNLFYAAKNRGQKIDLEKIWDHFKKRESEFLTDAIVYMIRSQDFNSSRFEAKLKYIGYNLCIKESERVFRDRRTVYKQTNHDVNITIDCIDRLNMFQKWILMSGDGDFADLAAYLKKRGKKVEVWSFEENHNATIEPYADKMRFLDDEFFLKEQNIDVFGFRKLK